MRNTIIVLFVSAFVAFPKVKAIENSTPVADREYWVNTLIRIADPVIRNLSEDKLKVSIPVGRSSSAKQVPVNLLHTWSRWGEPLPAWHHGWSLVLMKLPRSIACEVYRDVLQSVSKLGKSSFK